MSWRPDSNDDLTIASSAPELASLARAEVLADRFELIRKIGEGRFGVVYEARDLRDGSVLAVKALRESRPEWIDDLKREFRTLQDLAHPNLVELRELFVLEHRWFFTMELLHGTDLVEHVRSPVSGGLDPARLRNAFAQLLTGLATLHAAGKVHRDVKPSNVLVTSKRVVLLDFGLVSDADQEGRPTRHLVGTPAYMSPEQISMRHVGPAADLYAVGVMLYEGLSGALPFGGDPSRLLVQKRASDPAPLGPVPGVPPDLADLAVRLMARDPSQRPTALEALQILQDVPLSGVRGSHVGTPSVAPPSLLFGRDEELSVLEGMLSQAVAQGSLVVRVRGAPGIGKSALVAAFTGRLRDTGRAFVAAGRSYERESVPFKAFDTLIDGLVQSLLELGPDSRSLLSPSAWAALARVFPAFEALQSVDPNLIEEGDPREIRESAFAALRTLLAGLAREAPFVLWLDDVQWGDADSAALLNSLLRAPRATTVLVLLSYRPGESQTGAFLRALALPEGVSTASLDVRLLDAISSRALAEALFTQWPPLSAEFVDLAVQESQGNPLFMRQLCALAVEANGTEALPATGLSLERVIEMRFAGLSSEGKRLLEACAIARRPIPQSVCLQAAGLGSDGRLVVSELRAMHLLRSTGPALSDLVTTSHDRIAEAVVGSLPEDRIPYWHLQVGLALEESQSPDPEMLAAHFQGGGDLRRAARYALAAAEVAASALAFDRAVRLYQLALDLRAHLEPGAADELALRRALAEALVNAGRARDAASVFLECARLAEADAALDLRRLAGEQLLRSGHAEEGFAVLDTVRAALGVPTPPTPVQVVLSIARSSLRLALRGRAYRPREESEVPAPELRRVDALWSSSVATGTIDTLRGAEAQSAHILRALDLGEPYRVARALAMQASFLATGGPAWKPRFESLLAEARRAASLSANPHAEALTLLTEGMGSWMLGEFARARTQCLAAEAAFRRVCVGATWEISTSQVFGYNALAMRGELRELARLSLSHRAEARERNDRYAAWIPLSGFATVGYLAQGRAAEAQADLNDALAHWPSDRFTLQHNFACIAQVLLDLYCDTEGTLLRRARSEWWALQRSQLYRVQVVRIAFKGALGSCAVAAERYREHSRTALACASAMIREGAPWGLPGAAALRAAVAWGERHDARAVRYLTDAVNGFDSVGLALHAAAARIRLGRILKGDEGASLVAAGQRFLHAEAVVDAQRIVRVVVPGFASLD